MADNPEIDTRTTTESATKTSPTNGAMEQEDRATPERPWLRKVLLSAIIIIAFIAIIYGVRFLRFSATHASTDNAYLTSDIIQIAPQVAGIVRQVQVQDNQAVKKGDLLVTLDDATIRSVVQQAQANLDAAIAQAKGAGINVSITSQSSSAQVEQAQGGVSQSESGVRSAQADVARATAGVANASASAAAAKANIGNAAAAVNVANANKERSQDSVETAQAQLITAQAGVRAAQANVASAQAAYNKAASDVKRIEQLYRQGAISSQALDQANAAELQTKAGLESAQQAVAQAQSAVVGRQAELKAAKQAVNASSAAIEQAKAQLVAVREQANAAQTGVLQAQAILNASEQGIYAAVARRQQALAQLSGARTAPNQVKVSQTAQTQAIAKIEQAKAALHAAQIQLGYTKIYAPSDGRVSKRTVDVGSLVQMGTPMMALIPANDIWVVANFKETQLAKANPGQKAEIEVDGLPGKVFKGHVDSISPATGSTFALLPPENATGNFTKVVQRIPVKIIFEPNQPDLDRLRTGMSVTAIIETR